MLESDFQREYNIDVTTATLSWRRFITLLSGLSAESVFIYTVSEENKVKKQKANQIVEPSNVAHDMALMMANARKRKG